MPPKRERDEEPPHPPRGKRPAITPEQAAQDAAQYRQMSRAQEERLRKREEASAAARETQARLGQAVRGGVQQAGEVGRDFLGFLGEDVAPMAFGVARGAAHGAYNLAKSVLEDRAMRLRYAEEDRREEERNRGRDFARMPGGGPATDLVRDLVARRDTLEERSQQYYAERLAMAAQRREERLHADRNAILQRRNELDMQREMEAHRKYEDHHRSIRDMYAAQRTEALQKIELARLRARGEAELARHERRAYESEFNRLNTKETAARKAALEDAVAAARQREADVARDQAAQHGASEAGAPERPPAGPLPGGPIGQDPVAQAGRDVVDEVPDTGAADTNPPMARPAFGAAYDPGAAPPQGLDVGPEVRDGLPRAYLPGQEPDVPELSEFDQLLQELEELMRQRNGGGGGGGGGGPRR